MKKIVFLVVLSLLLVIIVLKSKNAVFTEQTTDVIQTSTAKENYAKYCAGCHGNQMDAFVDRKWIHGNSEDDLFKAIKFGYPDDGMSSFDTTFSDKEVNDLVAYIQDGIKNVDKYNFEAKFDADQVFESELFNYKLEKVMDGLDSPWGMAFLDNGDMLVTEKSGILYLKPKGKEAIKIDGVPKVQDRGQGGLLDIQLHPDFNKNRILYLSYSKPKMFGNKELVTTAVLKAKLENNKLVEQEIIFEAEPYLPTHHHYGSRLEFDKQGYLYFSVGERGRRDENPQTLSNDCGKIHRINDDGSVPDDNPFVNTKGAEASIWSYGHRNPQGVSMHPVTGQIWTHEHGPRGGDEINIVEAGKNYGWPVISYGINYNGTTFTDITEKEGMEQPLLYWIPSIAPCGSAFVTGDKYKGWEGDFLVGSLRFQYLDRCKIEDNNVVHQEMLLKNVGRLRSVEMGTDGYIYVGVERPGVIYRIIPVE